MIEITNYDIKLMLQESRHFMLKIEVLKDDGKTILHTIKGSIVGGNASIDSSSFVRRTFNVTIIPTLYDRDDTKIGHDRLVWLNKEIRVYVGIMDIRTKEYKFYRQGHFVYSNVSSTYDATTNQLSISCSDCMEKLNGTKNGQVGALKTIIPAYVEDPITGVPIKHNIIRDAVISVIEDLTDIENYFVDDIGEFYAMPVNNKDWESYRMNNPMWNTVPYDIEITSNTNVSSILEKLITLYPNYEMYFDENNLFICKMIPSCYEDKVILHDDFIKKIYISENKTLDLNSVRNVCEVWGQAIEADFYTESCRYENNRYICEVIGYDDKYYNGDIVAIKIDVSNAESPMININNFGDIRILDHNTNNGIKSGEMKSNNVYVFKIRSSSDGTNTITDCILLGQWQAHGMNVLTDGTAYDDFTFNDGIVMKKYSKEYFQKKYNCESVEFDIVPDSPFTVQKLGEILDVKSGGEYENITSDSLALARAKWENWKNARLTDSITLNVTYAPFFDVNMKISYINSDSDVEEQYIIKSVSHDFSSFTTSLSLMRFYPLYE